MRAKRLGFAELAGMLGIATAALSMPPACSHAPPPAAAASASQPPAPCTTPEPQRINVAASPRLNPGEKGEALATVVRLYQLKGIGKLTGVSFDDLLDRDKDALGEDLLGVQEVTVNPGEKLEPTVKRNPDTGYLMAVALFRQPAGTTWKVVKKLAPPDPQHCHVVAAQKNAQRVSDGTVRLFLDENRLELR